MGLWNWWMPTVGAPDARRRLVDQIKSTAPCKVLSGWPMAEQAPPRSRRAGRTVGAIEARSVV
jgi:hypothetical protein